VNPYWAAFAFPFKRENRGILVFGLFVLSVGPWILGLIPLGGSMVLFVVDLALLGYYAVFLRAILQTTMEGGDHIPPWPDMDSPFGLVEDFLSLLSPFLVSFLPLILFRASLAGFDALIDSGFVLRSSMPAPLTDGCLWRLSLEIPLLVLGWLYLPMATLAWTFYGGWSILNPVAVAKAAWSTGASYLGVVGLTWAMVTAAWTVRLIPGEYLTSFGSTLLVFYALIVAIRILGIHYRLHREQLGWERLRSDAV
jgi:hypothetical protein